MTSLSVMLEVVCMCSSTAAAAVAAEFLDIKGPHLKPTVSVLNWSQGGEELTLKTSLGKC